MLYNGGHICLQQTGSFLKLSLFSLNQESWNADASTRLENVSIQIQFSLKLKFFFALCGR